MKHLVPIIILLLSFSVFGQIKATTEDGKKVILKPDGTWEYAEKLKTDNSSTDDYKSAKSTATSFSDLVKFAKENKENLQKSEFETEKEYKERLIKLITESKVNNSSILIEVFNLEYHAEEQQFRGIILIGDINDPKAIVERKDGRFTTYLPYIKFKMLPSKAKEVRKDLIIKAIGFPVGVSSDGKLMFFPTKFIVFNNSTNEIYAEIEGTKLETENPGNKRPVK